MKPDERDDAAALMVLFVVVLIGLVILGVGAYLAFLQYGAAAMAS